MCNGKQGWKDPVEVHAEAEMLLKNGSQAKVGSVLCLINKICTNALNMHFATLEEITMLSGQIRWQESWKNNINDFQKVIKTTL